ncbi:hypothetical protein [Haloprofundus salinisoli]|uniref:hypothetical protein n=1 Tax=Haloprofundus salinisoli TaxID=2876193 RepID=UPI001CCEC2D6|nr:hypothetical protein [Haloprofundus salinisoli]
MTHKDSGWRPSVGTQTYAGFELWDHGSAPHKINDAQVDGDIEFDWEEIERAVRSRE